MKSICIAALLTLFFVPAAPAIAQGLNNHFAIDSADVQNALRFLGVEMYKFPIESPDPSKRYIINTILEEYRDGKLVHRHDEYAWAKHRFRDRETVEEMLPILDSEQTHGYIRVYTRKNGSHFVFNTSILYSENSLQVRAPANGWLTDSRAMDNRQLGRDPVPLVVYYGQRGSRGIMHCPGDRTVDEIRHDFGYAAILLAQLIEVKD